MKVTLPAGLPPFASLTVLVKRIGAPVPNCCEVALAEIVLVEDACTVTYFVVAVEGK